MGKAAWLSRTLILLVVLGLGLLLPTLFFDDAYITFRYAANLAAGAGFSYNPPENVLGATTPLLTVLLAAAARLGADIESAALVLGVAGHALLCLAVFEAVPLLLPGGDAAIPQRAPAALLGGLACALHPHLAFTAVGGMETSIYCALLIAVLAAAARGRGWLTGALFGAALLARPDAVLAAPAAAWLLWKGRRAAGLPGGVARTGAALRAGAAAVAVAGPWLLYALVRFGSPVPHSIAAKRIIHPYGALEVLQEFGRYLGGDPYLLVALPLAVWAVVRVGRSLSFAMAGFLLVYVGAVTFGGVEPFAWYVNPVIPPALALGAAGCADLMARAGARAAWVRVLPAALVALVAGADIRHQAPGLRDDWDAWEGTYEIAARWIMSDSRPGDRVFVGETGVIGYLLPGRTILDSSGINSPEVLRRRMGRAEADPEWSRRVIRELEPDYITTAVVYLNIDTVSSEPWFVERYEKAGPPLLDREGQVIYRRRRPA